MNGPPADTGSATGDLPQLLSRTVASLGLRVLAVGLGFAFNVLLARALGAGEAGLYLLALNIVTLLALAGRLGLDQVVVRSVAGHRADGDHDAASAVIKKSTGLTMVAAGGLMMLVWGGAGWMAEQFGLPRLGAPLSVLALAILPIALGDLWGEVLRGQSRIRASQTVKFVSTRLLTLLGFLVVGGVGGARVVSWVTVVACICTGLLAGLLLYPGLRGAGGRPYRLPLPVLLGPGATLFVTNLVAMAIQRQSLFVLAASSGSADAGVFASALRTAWLLTLVLQAVDSAAAPKFAALHQQGETSALDQVGRAVTRLIIMATVPAVVVVVAGRGLIMGVFGPEFVAGASALAILAVGQVTYALVGPTSALLVMSGHEALRLRLVLVTAVVSVVMNLLLVPAYGLNGAALATALTWALQNGLESYGARRVLGIRFLGLPGR